MVRKRIRLLTAFFIIFLTIGTAGCNVNLKSLTQKAKNSDEQLVRVQIQFDNQKQATCYVKSLGLEENARVYAGGPSTTYMYDRNGNIIGSFNYQHVIYMTILPEEVNTD
jgi:hypothetical protein